MRGTLPLLPILLALAGCERPTGLGSGELASDHVLSLGTFAPDGLLLTERNGRTWRLDAKTGRIALLAAPIVSRRTLAGSLESIWPDYRDARSLALVADREDHRDLHLPRVRAFDMKGKVVARSKPGVQEAFSLRVDRQGRAHWVESLSYEEHDWTWVCYDPANGRTVRRRLGARFWPLSVAPDGGTLVGETAEFADGAFALAALSGGVTPLPKLGGKACSAVFAENGDLLAVNGRETLPRGLSLEGYRYQLLRLDPRSRAWTLMPLVP